MDFPRTAISSHLFDWPEKKIFLEFYKYRRGFSVPTLNSLRVLEKMGYIEERAGGKRIIVDGSITSYDWTLKGRERLNELRRY